MLGYEMKCGRGCQARLYVQWIFKDFTDKPHSYVWGTDFSKEFESEFIWQDIEFFADSGGWLRN